jgi:hypothetical protein
MTLLKKKYLKEVRTRYFLEARQSGLRKPLFDDMLVLVGRRTSRVQGACCSVWDRTCFVERQTIGVQNAGCLVPGRMKPEIEL